jgi:hypothetical protein
VAQHDPPVTITPIYRMSTTLAAKMVPFRAGPPVPVGVKIRR